MDLTTVIYLALGVLAVAWLAAAVWVVLGSLAEALGLARVAAWFQRHGV